MRCALSNGSGIAVKVSACGCREVAVAGAFCPWQMGPKRDTVRICLAFKFQAKILSPCSLRPKEWETSCTASACLCKFKGKDIFQWSLRSCEKVDFKSLGKRASSKISSIPSRYAMNSDNLNA